MMDGNPLGSAILGVGTDILNIDRVARVIQRSGPRLGERILSPAERKRVDVLDPRAVAKAFAAKEAVSKALGTGFRGGISWQHIQLTRDSLGRPMVELTAAAASRLTQLGGAEVLLSLSDEASMVLAFAVVSAQLPSHGQ